MIVEDLLPVTRRTSLEAFAKFGKALTIAQVQSIQSNVEIPDHAIKSKLDSGCTRAIMDLGLTFVTQVVTLQLVDLEQLGFLVPRTFGFKEQCFLKNSCHGPFYLTC